MPRTPTYLFTKLNDLKPEMIGEATSSARRANQGLFEILPRDRAQGMNEEGQIRKTVRVVTTVEYQLAD